MGGLRHHIFLMLLMQRYGGLKIIAQVRSIDIRIDSRYNTWSDKGEWKKK